MAADASPPLLVPVSLPAEEQPPVPDLTDVVTEDDTAMDNLFSERQMKLLTRSLEAGWRPAGGRRFLAMANVGLFTSARRPPVVPDVLVSLDVTAPETDLLRKEHRSYFVWEYDKPPDVVVEIVSNREGGETDRKQAEYARIGVRYYAIFDPAHYVQDEDLRTFVLQGHDYLPLVQPRFGSTGLGLVLWRGAFADLETTWLRWVDEQGNLILTGEERADAEHARADAAQAQANAAQARAEAAEAENAALRARLRTLEEGRRG